MQSIRDSVENYIKENIPLTKTLDVKIIQLDQTGAVFSAPLEPNINDKSVGFAGSIETLLTITSWGWLFALFLKVDPKVQLYIRRCSFEFNRPVEKDLLAFIDTPDNDTIGRFFADYKTSGKARISIKAFIGEKNDPDSEFSGTFVALSMNSRLLLLNR
ncbi:MAG: YiiD C-terminal domain-containing protein [Spirochaetes bacterium]|nr:YiiD C-terminal domain-containing protein [Spirochaetota bacterium]